MKQKKKNQNQLNQILKLIKENDKLVFLQDVYQSIGMSASSFYRHYPTDSDDYQLIIEALEANKTLMKREIRDRLAECKNPSGLIFLYKILTTDKKERQELDGKYVESIQPQDATIVLKI